jgi:ABC-type bacteriocin/lantibiotic exporter with double-glycine peptidase domain
MAILGDILGGMKRMVEDGLAMRHDRVVLEDFPSVVRLDSYSCGTQCVDMVLRYELGLRVPLEELKERCNTTFENGTETEDVIDCLAHYGLQAVSRFRHKGMKEAIRRQIDAGHPVMAVVPSLREGTEHWIVIFGYRVRDKRFLVRDPRVLYTRTDGIKAYLRIGGESRHERKKRIFRSFKTSRS